ncbi:MAG: 50S ribosomal protein L28 [Deltaproteobacteria bacterium]|nr:50S ribosomal protein L28 [Deltaproteobacteria bacterium]
MARKCSISGTSRQTGHRVSHANNKRKHVFKANIQKRRVFIPEENRFVTIKVSTRVIRTIDKLGLNETLRQHNLSLADIS